MTAAESLKLYELLKPLFKSEGKIKVLVAQVEEIFEDKVRVLKDEFSSKSEVGLLRKDMDIMKIELKAEIEKSGYRVENNLKSEINKLIIWIVATIFAAAALILTIAKLLF